MKTIALTIYLLAAISSLRAADLSGPQDYYGKVTETMNAAGYTYMLVDTGTAKNWTAAPQMTVAVGDSVKVTGGMPMPKYHSKSLKRDFDVVYFTGEAVVMGAPVAPVSPAAAPALPAVKLPPGHPPVPTPAAVDFTGIKPAKGGQTVESINTNRLALAGKTVAVRGKVVRYNGDVMQKNWLHLRDGSGSLGNNDLTVTTTATAKVGDTVLLSGKVAVDRDFGSGYKYSVIIEDAEVAVE